MFFLICSSLASADYDSEGFGGKTTITTDAVITWDSEGFGGRVSITQPGVNFTSTGFGGKISLYGWEEWSPWWNITQSQFSSPTGFNAVNYNNSRIDLSWTENIYADATYIRGKKGSSPVSINDGFFVYNDTDESFSNTGLDLGTHYYYSAWSWNDTSGYSSNYATADAYTSPGDPSNLHNTSIDRNTISLSWTKGVNATYSVIRYQEGSYPATPQSGTEGYNGTLNSADVNSLYANTTYYFRIWSYNNPFSEGYDELIETTLTADIPDPPYNGSIRVVDSSTINITWNRGNYSNEDVVIRKSGGYATSPGDGTIVDRTNNNTGGTPVLYYYTETGLTQSYYYCIYSYNTTNMTYSATSLLIDQPSAVGLNCFNESNPSQALIFDILISNENTSQTYQADGLSNTHWIPVESIPYGEDTIFYVSSDGYKSRTYYYDITLGYFYNMTFYLPPEETSDGGGGGEVGTLRQFTNAVSITNPSVNASIPLSHEIEDLIGVYIYEEILDLVLKTDSISVTDPDSNVTIPYTKTPVEFDGCYIYNSSIYGGWITVPDDKWEDKGTYAEIDESVLDDNTTIAKVQYYYNKVSFSQWKQVPDDYFTIYPTNVSIDADYMDDNTTMAKVDYYYMSYENATLSTKLYIIKVLNAYDQGIDDATVDIRRYMNTTASFQPVTILKTDANGQAETYLIPHVLYKIFISADSYVDEISEWIPDDEFYGIYYPKVFRMNFISPSLITDENLFDNITWSIEPTIYYHNTSFYVYYNITSDNNRLEWFNATLYFWNTTTLTWVMLNTSNLTTAGGGSISFLVNGSNIGKYSFLCMFKKENFSAYRFGTEDGCRMYFVYLDVISAQVSTIPELVYLIITVVFVILTIGFLVKFGAGAKSGVGGLAVMGFMFALRPDLAFEGISVWFIFLATTITYAIIMFITRSH